MIDKDGRDRSTASTYAFIGISQYTIDLNKQIAFSEGVHIGNGLPRLEKLIADEWLLRVSNQVFQVCNEHMGLCGRSCTPYPKFSRAEIWQRRNLLGNISTKDLEMV